jgi:tetratricopeptide (TPR) repeat protein
MSLALSDLHLLSQYIQRPGRFTESVDLYKIVAAGASQNLQLDEVNELNSQQRELIHIRSKIFLGQESPDALIQQLDVLEEGFRNRTDICFVDIKAVKANLLQRLGDYEGAARLQLQASEMFFRLGDEFRGVRAVVNSRLYLASSPASYQSGELRILLQQVHRQRFYDLAGHIYRGLALELFNSGDYAQARIAIHSAIANYRLLSFADDESIALYLSVLIHLQLNNHERARRDFARAPVQSGKASVYYQAAKTYLSGLIPKIPEGHPLSRAHWPKAIQRQNSLPIRVIELLKMKPMTRDELIYKLWGDTAISESYCSRLYVLVNQIRKKNLAQIIFNGEKYELKMNGSSERQF